jgi:hypothetical protein
MSQLVNRRILARWLSVLVPTIATFVVAMLISLSRWPVPRMHDDFSNLLVAETLLQGRVCNPTPPAFESMESFHIVMTPHYASKFPIGPGAMLALGALIFGTTVAGLWLSASMATACVTWMLLSRFSPKWTFVIGMLLALHPSLQNGWAQEFTHGWLPLSGVALVMGGVLRTRSNVLERCGTYKSAIAIGIGSVLVLYARPFDAGIICGLLIVSLVPKLVSQRWHQKVSFWRMAMISIGVVGSGLVGQAAINASITGRMTQLPYQLHEEQYGVAPLFVWSRPHEPSIGHRFAELETYHRGCSLQSWEQAASPMGYCKLFRDRVSNLFLHWGGLLCLLPFSVLLISKERRRYSWMWLIVIATLLIINCIPWVMPAYTAGLIPIAILLSSLGVRGFTRWYAKCLLMNQDKFDNQGVHRLKSFRRRIRLGALGLIGLSQITAFAITSYARSTYQTGWESNWADQRTALNDRLQRIPGKHLVLVQYGTGHDVQEEWVYNSADIMNAPVLWARYGNDEMNELLRRSYGERQAWLLSIGPSGSATSKTSSENHVQLVRLLSQEQPHEPPVH